MRVSSVTVCTLAAIATWSLNQPTQAETVQPLPSTPSADDDTQSRSNPFPPTVTTTPPEQTERQEFAAPDEQFSEGMAPPTENIETQETVSSSPNPSPDDPHSSNLSVQERLDEHLAEIVAADRDARDAEFRQTLMETAHRYAASGNLEQARQIAQHPALSAEWQQVILDHVRSYEPHSSPDLTTLSPHTLTPSPPLPSDRLVEWALPNLNVPFRLPSPSHPRLLPTPSPTSHLCQPQGNWLALSDDEQKALKSTGQEFVVVLLNALGMAIAPQSQSVDSLLTDEALSATDAIFGQRAFSKVLQSLMSTRSSCDQALSNSQELEPRTNASRSPLLFTGVQSLLQQTRMSFPLPFLAELTSVFGWRLHPITGENRFHDGLDYAAPEGTPVLAVLSGQVKAADWMGGYGLTVRIEHPQSQQETLYAHLSHITVSPNTWVEPGTVIGFVGSTGNSTGPHLHFEIRQPTENGWVAIDPLPQMTLAQDSLSTSPSALITALNNRSGLLPSLSTSIVVQRFLGNAPLPPNPIWLSQNNVDTESSLQTLSPLPPLPAIARVPETRSRSVPIPTTADQLQWFQRPLPSTPATASVQILDQIASPLLEEEQERSNPGWEVLSASERLNHLNLENFQHWANLCDTLVISEQYVEALTACDRAIGLDPKAVDPWVNRGTILIQFRQYSEAIAAYTFALRQEAQHSQASTQ